MKLDVGGTLVIELLEEVCADCGANAGKEECSWAVGVKIGKDLVGELAAGGAAWVDGTNALNE